jgi:hypothetical protein
VRTKTALALRISQIARDIKQVRIPTEWLMWTEYVEEDLDHRTGNVGNIQITAR